MIKSFADRLTEALYHGERVRAYQAIQEKAERKLVMLESATELADLREPPGNRLEALKGNREGQFSIRIDRQWRLCFRWVEGHAYDVEIVDYHR